MDAILVLVGVVWFPAILALEITSPVSNLTNSTNDMYVIHATVYQVGIITNKSDDEIANMTGNQEALSFYHNNGSAMDLSAIPAPLLTNVTAQSAMAVAPVQLGASSHTPLAAPLAELDQLTLRKSRPTVKTSENSANRSVYVNLSRRSTSNSSGPGPTIKVVKETSLIPSEVGLQSIGLPELIGLNTSLASIPLPIPNTSIMRYAKVNTLVKAKN